jgi:hypothetical protein
MSVRWLRANQNGEVSLRDVESGPRIAMLGFGVAMAIKEYT